MSPSANTKREDGGRAIQLAQIGLWQAVMVTAITALAGVGGAYIQYSLGSGKQEVRTDKADTSISTVERQALYRLTAAYLEDDLALTSGKRRFLQADSSPAEKRELEFRMLQRAVFLNMSVLQANDTILENTLKELEAHGLDWVAAQKSRVLAEFSAIKVLRLRWLEDVAMPALQRAHEDFPPMTQSVPMANVALPSEIRILEQEIPSGPTANPYSPEEPTVSVHSMQALRDEVELLKRSLSPSGPSEEDGESD